MKSQDSELFPETSKESAWGFEWGSSVTWLCRGWPRHTGVTEQQTIQPTEPEDWNSSLPYPRRGIISTLLFYLVLLPSLEGLLPLVLILYFLLFYNTFSQSKGSINGPYISVGWEAGRSPGLTWDAGRQSSFLEVLIGCRHSQPLASEGQRLRPKRLLSSLAPGPLPPAFREQTQVRHSHISTLTWRDCTATRKYRVHIRW